MTQSTDTDLTLPSIEAAAAPVYGDVEPVLTIVFHPDTTRIGERAVVVRQSAAIPWVLGRRSPDFGRSPALQDGDGKSGAPLDDPHVSRQALEFSHRRGGLLITRIDGSSRVRLDATELTDSVELNTQQLRTGVSLMLGHSVVLMLRLAPRGAAPLEQASDKDLLRGSSSAMAGIRAQLLRAAASDLDVLIRGETGTGKELVATAIHRASARAAGPMVTVNMAAVAKELAPAALFGSARGAYTGADGAKIGYFEQAHGGTLFLDEIGDTSPEVQPQLLRALQQREIQVVGGGIKKVDVRVISATDAALDDEAVDFKAALRHRLGAIELRLPALREHPEDIGELLLFFLQGSTGHATSGESLPTTQSPALDIASWASLFFNLARYDWPGNVRELSNIAQQLVLSGDSDAPLTERIAAILVLVSPRQPGTTPPVKRRKIQDVEEDEFDAAMASCGFEPLQVSRALGVSRTAVYRRIESSASYRLVNRIPRVELALALADHKDDSVAAARQLRVSNTSLRARLRQLHLSFH